MMVAYFKCSGCKMAWSDKGVMDEMMERQGRAGCPFGCKKEDGHHLILYKADEIKEGEKNEERESG